MLNSNEIGQAEMPLATLTVFNYITHGISSEVELDCAIDDEIELDFD